MIRRKTTRRNLYLADLADGMMTKDVAAKHGVGQSAVSNLTFNYDARREYNAAWMRAKRGSTNRRKCSTCGRQGHDRRGCEGASA